MLIEFNIENFKSFKDEKTISLIASADKSLSNNTFSVESMNGDRLLKSAVVYGANASGKSNIVYALAYLKHLVLTSHKNQKDVKLNYTPFKLDNSFLKKPTRISISFIKNRIKYYYTVAFVSNKIVEESLYYSPKGRMSLLFERTNTNDFEFIKDKKIQKFISERTLENVLYLSNATQLKYEFVNPAFDWFKDNLSIINPTDHPNLTERTINLMNENLKFKERILLALNKADLGIDDMSAIVKELSEEDLSEFPPEFKNYLLKQKNKPKRTEIKTIHKVKSNTGKEKKIEFDFYEESEGTRRLFGLIGPWIDALNQNKVLVVDELDSKLHHLLNLLLIKLIHNPEQNKKNSQLIFTTHNTNLLDQTIFRRDQIWFTEKNPKEGNTDLYSLMEFSPRKDKDIQKGYLRGRYGAIPFIREISFV